jgi:hypothetical protein
MFFAESVINSFEIFILASTERITGMIKRGCATEYGCIHKKVLQYIQNPRVPFFTIMNNILMANISTTVIIDYLRNLMAYG